MAAVDDPDGAGPGVARVEQFVYDNVGRPVGTRTGNATNITTIGWSCTSYDERGRLTQQTWPARDGSPARTVTHTYAWNGNALQTRVVDGSQSVWASFDIDWSAEVAEMGPQAVGAAVDAVIGAEYVEGPDAACAISAADVVARLVSGRGEDSAYGEEVVAWVLRPMLCHRPLLSWPRLRKRSRACVAMTRSFELWSQDASSLAAWLASLAGVEQRLGA